MRQYLENDESANLLLMSIND